jgi:hypothetical protein
MKSSIGIIIARARLHFAKIFAARVLDAIAFGTVEQPDGLFGVAA